MTELKFFPKHKHYSNNRELQTAYEWGYKDGAEFGYNKANEDTRLKLKDEGIVKSLKDSILQNERLSSQEQQELCAWIECAMDFGSNLDECADQLIKATEILSKLLEEEKNNMYWEMNGSDKSSYYEVRKQAEQFLKDSEVKK